MMDLETQIMQRIPNGYVGIDGDFMDHHWTAMQAAVHFWVGSSLYRVYSADHFGTTCGALHL